MIEELKNFMIGFLKFILLIFSSIITLGILISLYYEIGLCFKLFGAILFSPEHFLSILKFVAMLFAIYITGFILMIAFMFGSDIYD